MTAIFAYWTNPNKNYGYSYCKIANFQYFLSWKKIAILASNSGLKGKFKHFDLGTGPGGGRGVLKFGFGRDMPLRNLKVYPYKYPFFKKKWPTHIPIGQIFCQILSKIAQFFQNLDQFCFKVGKILKNQPIHIPNSAFYKGLFIYQEADFATHVGGTSP